MFAGWRIRNELSHWDPASTFVYPRRAVYRRGQGSFPKGRPKDVLEMRKTVLIGSNFKSLGRVEEEALTYIHYLLYMCKAER